MVNLATDQLRARRTASAVTYQDKEGSIGEIGGYAAVFGEETLIRSEAGYAWRERIGATAFDEVLKTDDVVATFNHQSGNLLGRTASGTLRLQRDAHGLKYSVDLPDTSLGRDVQVLVKRGDLHGSSFKFAVAEGGYSIVERGKTPDDPPLVQINRIKRLMDVGPVTEPAYDGTSVTARSAPEAVESLYRELERERVADAEQRAVVEAAKPAAIRERESLRAAVDTAKAWRT